MNVPDVRRTTYLPKVVIGIPAAVAEEGDESEECQDENRTTGREQLDGLVLLAPGLADPFEDIQKCDT